MYTKILIQFDLEVVTGMHIGGSNTYAPTPRKKQTQYFLSAGSVLKNRYRGEVYRIGTQGNHPVLRYSKPIFLGVNL